MKRLLIIVALIATVASCAKNELGKAADTVKKLNTDLYTMKITGDAGFELFIESGGARSTDELADFISDYLSVGPFGKLKCALTPADFGCSALSVTSPDGHALTGRNFDWDNCKAMIVRSFPDHGYASVSTANLDFLGFGEDYTPKGLINQFKATASIYVPMDGINEKGLVVSDLMAGDTEVTDMKDKGKLNLTTTTAIRMLLNHAADVDEAVSMLEGINMHSDIGSAHHLFLSDASGRSAVVEWVANSMKVIDSPVLNNHYLCAEKSGVGSSQASFEHERKLLELRDKSSGVMTLEELADAMFAVISLPDESYYGGTQWTVVYDNVDRSAVYYWRRDRSRTYGYLAGADVEWQ